MADIVRELADAEGYEHVSDWVAHVVAERIDQSDLSKIRKQQNEQRSDSLPLEEEGPS